MTGRLPASADQGSASEHAPRATHHAPTSPLAARLQACAGVVPKKAAVAWAQFVATVAQLEAKEVRDNASKMIGLVIEAGYEDYLEESYANYRSRLEDLEQLAVFARQFPTVEDFLTQLALLTNLEAEAEQPARTDDERLRLSTIHQAKGLEFDVVFVIMLCDGLFPSERSLETTDGRGGGAAADVCGHHAGAERALPELPAYARRLRRQRGHDAAAVAVPGGDSRGPGGGVGFENRERAGRSSAGSGHSLLGFFNPSARNCVTSLNLAAFAGLMYHQRLMGLDAGAGHFRLGRAAGRVRAGLGLVRQRAGDLG